MRHAFALWFILLLACAAGGQANCPALRAPAIEPGKILFTPQQEMELGEIMRQQAERDFLVIDEKALTGYVKSVGDRVASHLPDSGLHYQFLLYDRTEIQAFGMPGGRVYISRKMVAFLRNEDELAGLLGHEMGHMAARQQALQVSQEFREILSVQKLDAGEDLFERYNEMVDRLRWRKSRTSGNGEKGQEDADQLGVQAVARAGYSPQAFPDLLDRLMETKGVAGSWLSDLFGTTRADSRRLRQVLRDVSNLPAACIEKNPQIQDAEAFHQWQAAVLHYRGIGHEERLPKVLARIHLNDPLRGDIQTFRFSSDGKYLLAQDDGGIYVSTREPLQFRFRIEAPDAEPAQFSPDAKHVVFFNHSLRVETWDVEQQEQVSVADVPALHSCSQTALSPDARYLACLGGNMALTLYDVPTGDTVLQVEKFFGFDTGGAYGRNLIALLFYAIHGNSVTLRFSPDGHFFAASSRTDQEVVFDLIERRKLKISEALRSAISYAFTFVGQDRIVGVDREHIEKSPLLEFPSGKVIDRFPLGGDFLISATNPKYVLAGPLKDRPIGAYDLTQKKVVFANRSAAVDVRGEAAASERLNGEIGVYRVGEAKPTGVLTPPLGKLGTLRAFAASPDLKWLAISGRTRGGEWNIGENARILLSRSFQNASYASDSTLLLDFPHFEQNDRELVVLPSGSKEARKHIPVGAKDGIDFFGSVYVRMKPREDKPSMRNLVLEALDSTSDQQLWSRNFPKQGPQLFLSASGEQLVFLWPAKKPTACGRKWHEAPSL
jgi:WD40 repeat protein